MSRARMTWSTVGLVVLLVVTAVVALAALRGTSGSPPPRPASSALASSPGPAATGSSRPAVDSRLQVTQPLLVLVDARVAYRGTPGVCDGGATLERSVDGGRSWKKLDPPGPALASFRALTATAVQAVTACQPQLWTSGDAGATWAGPAPADPLWYRDPTTPATLHTPTGDISTPCPDVTLAPLELVALTGTDAYLLCSGGTLVGTTDGGATWAQVSSVPEAVAMAWESRDLGWLLTASAPSCRGLGLVRTTDGGATWQGGVCVGDRAVTDPLNGPLPALAFANGTLGMAVVGDRTYLSRDSGNTWTAVG